MAKFDFIECSSKSYQYIWDFRHVIMRQSALLLLVKFVSFSVVLFFGLEANILRQGLLLLPSYYLEGWVIANIVVTALRNEKDRAYQILAENFSNTHRNIIASTIIFVLIKLLMALLIGVPSAFISDEAEAVAIASQTPPQEPGLVVLFGISVVLVALIWMFKYLWLYIPVMLGFSARKFLLRVRSFMSSFYMLALWVLCAVPVSIALLFCVSIVSAAFPDQSGLGAYAQTLVQVVFDYIMVLVTSLAMAYGVSSVFNKEDKNVSLL